MTLSVVQSAGQAPTGGGSSNIVFTLGAAPAVGNLLLACCAYNKITPSFSTPAGWIKVVDFAGGGGGGQGIATFRRNVQAGDGTTWTFPSPIAFNSGGMLEITGHDPVSPVNQQSTFNQASGVTTFPTTAITPSVLGCLAVAVWCLNGVGESFSNIIPAGWTADVNEIVSGQFTVSLTGHQNTLTTDLATAISPSLHITGSNSDTGVSELFLIAPAPPPVVSAQQQQQSGRTLLRKRLMYADI